MNKPYLQDTGTLFLELKSGAEGLTEQEAAERLAEYGPNKLKEKEKTPLWKRFVDQFKDPMILMLLAAAVISGVTSVYSGESPADVIIILAVVLMNSVLGVYQESKAENAIDALEKMTKATARVMRDGKLRVVESEKLVPGDVIHLEAGDAVPADARLIHSSSLKTIESALTGESTAVSKLIDILNTGAAKDVPLGDRKNMVYAGSTVDYGRGTAIVTATGMETEMGRIADAISEAAETKTPLQKKMAQLSKVLTYLVVCISVLVFAINMIRHSGGGESQLLLNSFMTAVALAVAAIPEGLPAVVTIILSMGVSRMSERKSIVRKLNAVETLGCTQVVCSDKTGTLTQNKMTVVERLTDDEKELQRGMSLCSDAVSNENGRAVGEATECALVNDALEAGFDKSRETGFVRVDEAPFDSMRKMMTVVVRTPEGKLVQYTKGAPDIVLGRCTSIWKQGKKIPLTEEERDRVKAANKGFADKALRVLALARKELDTMPGDSSPEALEQELCFTGLSAMIDPVRPEVADAVAKCGMAGVRVVMITGDHIDTAVAIAEQLGILRNGLKAVTGAQLDGMDDETFEKEIQSIAVYARVQPEHKVRIVKTWQKLGMVTAMTGDGVNDAPSIKSADIGLGMGITGTDVTRNVADMVLADDNFATIVSAVEEGRRIYDNIRKCIQFQLSTNLGEVVCVFAATLIGIEVLSPAELLWINMITDSFPAIALGMEKAEPDIMQHAPRKSDESVFAGGMGAQIAAQGLFIGLMTVVSFMFGNYFETGRFGVAPSAAGETMAFLTINMFELLHSLNMRSMEKSCLTLKNSNRLLGVGVMVSMLVTIAVMYIPFFERAFGFERLTAPEFATAFVIGCLIIPVTEITKLIHRLQKERGRRG